MKAARFVAAARDEFLAAVLHYNNHEPGLGTRFATRSSPASPAWDQVNGLRGQTDTPEKLALRIRHDLWYIQNGEPWLDLEIVLMTLTPMTCVLLQRNAY